MDVTGGGAVQIADAIKKVPEELQPVLQQVFDRMTTLETKIASDENAIVTKVLEEIGPRLDAIVQTVNAVSDQALTFLRSLDGASVKLTLNTPNLMEQKTEVPGANN